MRSYGRFFDAGVCLFVLMILGSVHPRLAAETLKNPRMIFTGTNPSTVSVGDFNGDGKPDLAYLDGGSPVPGAEIFYGNGDGTFEPPVILRYSRDYGQIAIADMNNDGKPDLVLADGNILSVIHNNGGRSFGPEIEYIAGSVNSFVVQDLNGDNLPDVVVPSAPNTVTVLLSQPGGVEVNGTFTASPQPVTLGVPLALSLVLVPSTATGFVTFSIDNVFLAEVPVVSGTASFSLADSSIIALGAHSVTAVYSGNATLTHATFVASLTVVPVIHPVTVALSAAPNPAIASQTVRFAAAISSAGPVPTGTVAFHDGSTTLGSVSLNSGVALLDTALLSAGAHSVTASYSGDVNSAPGTSSPVMVTITAFLTNTGLSSIPATPQNGASFVLSATVSSSNGTPTGSVVFLDGASSLGARALDSNGVAVFSSTFTNPGTHTFTAGYQANGEFAASTSSILSLVADPSPVAATTLSLSAPTDMQNAAPLNFTAQMASTGGVPTGKVAFYDGSVFLGDAGIEQSGMATLEVAAVIPGNRYITAVYSGSGRFGRSASALLVSEPSAGPKDFALYLSSASEVVPEGGTAQLQVTFAPLPGFNQEVHFNCNSSMAEISCVFQPASLAGGGTSQMTLVASPQAALVSSSRWPAVWPAASCLGLLILAASTKRRKRMVLTILGLLLLAAALGCGARAAKTPTALTVGVTASSAQQNGVAVTHSVNLQVVLQPR
jgi:hypothetical protein